MDISVLLRLNQGRQRNILSGTSIVRSSLSSSSSVITPMSDIACVVALHMQVRNQFHQISVPPHEIIGLSQNQIASRWELTVTASIVMAKCTASIIQNSDECSNLEFSTTITCAQTSSRQSSDIASSAASFKTTFPLAKSLQMKLNQHATLDFGSSYYHRSLLGTHVAFMANYSPKSYCYSNSNRAREQHVKRGLSHQESLNLGIVAQRDRECIQRVGRAKLITKTTLTILKRNSHHFRRKYRHFPVQRVSMSQSGFWYSSRQLHGSDIRTQFKNREITVQ